MRTLGEIAYEAYCTRKKWAYGPLQTITPFKNLPESEQRLWEFAAQEVVYAFERDQALPY